MNSRKTPAKRDGFTLLELLIVLAILSILIAAVVIAINPGKQFSKARNAQRQANLRATITAIYENIINNRGAFVCTAGPVPTTVTTIKKGTGGYDLCSCLVPEYLPLIMVDPSTGTGEDCSAYDSGYTIVRDVFSGRITVAAPATELGETISITY